MGFVCLVGIAHLPEKMSSLSLCKKFEVTPMTSTNLKPVIEDELLKSLSAKEGLICMNLLAAVKLIAKKILSNIKAGGNVHY